MQDTVMDKTRLAAFADGELPPEEAAEVVMHLADHPQDQAFVDDLMAANQALLRAFSAPMSQPVPEAILTAIQGPKAAPASAPTSGRVIAFPARRVWALGALALAASVALAVVLIPGQEPNGLRLGPVASNSALHDHLTALGSGQTVGFGTGELTILATLPVDAGHCREVEVIDRSTARLEVGLACHRGTGWQIDVALAETLPDNAATSDFVPATGAEAQALTPWLDRLGAGLVLSPEAEADLIARAWQP